jgi:hypothetical protein
LKRFLHQLTSTALLLATALPGAAWAGATFNQTLKLQGISFHSDHSPINLQELGGAMAQGYQGNDQFDVVEGCVVRRFPIYKPGDSNAKASGGERQICSTLKAGEASWILRPTSMLKF